MSKTHSNPDQQLTVPVKRPSRAFQTASRLSRRATLSARGVMPSGKICCSRLVMCCFLELPSAPMVAEYLHSRGTERMVWWPASECPSLPMVAALHPALTAHTRDQWWLNSCTTLLNLACSRMAMCCLWEQPSASIAQLCTNQELQ